jgi:hypothetical protein
MNELDDLPLETETPSATTTRRSFTLVRTQRVLQGILGLFWLLDAGLQFQPYMFGQGFVSTYLLHNAGGQPAVISWLITNVGHLVGPHVAVWNTFFALIQVAIGLGLLFRPTVRLALAVSFVWAFGVWFFGEGLGLIFTGTASALTGAPGSVFMYGLIGLMAWPRSSRTGEEGAIEQRQPVGVASSAAGHGIGGAVTALVVWSGYWSLAAVLFLLPDNRTQTSVSSAIVGMAPGEPHTYSRFLSTFGNHFGSVGTQTTWVLAIISLIIGFAPLLARRPAPFLLAGGLFSLFFWITGQGLGGIFTGSGTDPNTGPLIFLLALAMVPVALPERSEWRPPVLGLLRWNPIVGLGSLSVVVTAILLSALYPAAAQESTGMAMSGMAGMPASGGNTASSASCSSGNNGAPRTGLDLNNTPNMIMSGTLGMNMNGTDASAAAGLNTTKANWHYTGPPLPQALAQELLAEGSNAPQAIHMATSGCAPEPTFSQEINAAQYVQSTSQSVARFTNPFAAVAAGYVAASPTNYPVVYYVNPAIIAANAAAKRTLSPPAVDGLVYAQTPSGSEVLAAAMYILPTTVGSAPMPDGALVQWHQRTVVCGPAAASTTTLLDITGVPPCSTGSVQRPTPYTTMVWQIPVAGGPLAIQPPDIQIVEAAVMASAT